MIVEATRRVVAGQSLTYDEAAAVMGEIMDGSPTPAQFGAFMAALSMKGESADEIAAMATVMRDRSRKVEIAGVDLVDTCGTGGDGKQTYNISTAAAFVLAGAGAKVAKHGNRAATSRCGSADVLEALGAKIELSPEAVSNCVKAAGVGFMFAPAYHPAMKFAAPLRREIGIRTVFNILGPLTNPASAKHQILGVNRVELVEKMAAVLSRMGARHALVVHGREGLDELSIAGPSLVAEAKNGRMSAYEVEPRQFGLGTAPLDAIAGGTAQENAATIRSVLSGESGPRRDVLLLNAGAGLVAAGLAADIAAGIRLAARSIDRGAAGNALDGFIAVSNRV